MSEFGYAPEKSDDWYTPRYVFDALGVSFDLDVSAPVEGPRYVPAARWLWERGLEQAWEGFVWMNPPYGHQSTKIAWLDKFIKHGNGIALLPDRTSAPWWQWAVPHMEKSFATFCLTCLMGSLTCVLGNFLPPLLVRRAARDGRFHHTRGRDARRDRG